MKSIIYSRVSTKDQSTRRQIEEMSSISGFSVKKVFSEKISGFSKRMSERPILQEALSYLKNNNIKCLMVSEVSRLGRNTSEVLNLIEQFKEDSISLYIHNLGTTLNTNNSQSDIFTKLIITLLADISRIESEQLSYRIRSGIRSRKAKGLTTGRKIGSFESIDKFLSKHPGISKYVHRGYSSREIQRICKCSPNTIKKVRDGLRIVRNELTSNKAKNSV